MPDFTRPPTSQVTKILYLGHSGAGKTGSLASLAAAGYNVRILDLDGSPEQPGCEILRDFVQNPRSIYRQPRPGLWTAEQATSMPSRLSYVSIYEDYTIQGVKRVPRGMAWKKINDQLANWTDGPTKLGPATSWTPSEVLVIDGLSRLCEMAMNFQLTISGHILQGPQVGTRETNDYSAAYKYILDFLDDIKSGSYKCNIILICHIEFLFPEGPRQSDTTPANRRGFPQTIGPKISPRIGQYFNHSLRALSMGNAPAIRRVIITNSDENIELKNTAPLRVPREYPLETGLAEYFRDIRTSEGIKL